MVETRHAAPPTHLPWFITEPGQIDTLMVFAGAFVVLFTLTMGVLMLRLLYLPVEMVSQEQKAKYEVVATLVLLDFFVPGFFLWIAALLLAMTDIPDYTPLIQRIAEAVQRIAQSKTMLRDQAFENRAVGDSEEIGTVERRDKDAVGMPREQARKVGPAH